MTHPRWPLVVSSLVLVACWTLGESRPLARQNPPPAPARDAQRGPQPPRDPRPATIPTGTGSISGSVVVGGSGQPARRARVNLSALSTDGTGGGGRSATTDDAGRFAFSGLPAGRFMLSASKPGYVGASYGQRRPGRAGIAIQLADGQKMQAPLVMWRGGVITGTIVDEHGEAIPGTPVRALRFVFQAGQRTVQASGSGQTDDRGVYRIYGLQPGDYIVSATPRNTNQGFDGPRAAELQALMQNAELLARTNAPQAQAAIDRLAQVRAAMAGTPASDEPTTGYAPVYYPGTTMPASAGTIQVGAGEEKAGVDFQYQVVPIAQIEGMVISTGAQAPNGLQISLVNTTVDIPGTSPGITRTDASGAFRIANVPPGQYTLVARATIGNGRDGGPGGRGGPLAGGRGEAFGGRGRAGAGAGPATQPTRLWGSTDVTVDGRNLSNIVVTLQPGVSVAGRVVFEGQTPPPADLTRLRVTLQPIAQPGTAGEMMMSAGGSVDADGHFTLASVVPGRYRLSGSAGGAGNGWFLGSAAVDGSDALDVPLEVKANAGISGAVVTFVDRQTELTGSVVNERAQPVPDYTLIVYPVDTRYWTPQTRRIQSARPATDGRFSFRNLPPGEYALAPVLDPEPGSWFDPAFLRQLDNTAVRVSLGDGEKKEQNLRVPDLR